MNLVKYIVFILIISFSSCVKDVEYKLDFEGSKMVVFAGGGADQVLGALITRTIPPLTKTDNLDSLIVDNAIVQLYENNSLVDTLKYIENGIYQSNIFMKEENNYFIKANAKNLPSITSGKDTVPISAKILDADITIESIDSFISGDIYVHYNTYVKVTKSIKYPYNTVWIYLYIGDRVKQLYYFLNSKSDFLECENCYRLLDSPCINKVADNTFELVNTVSDYDADYLPEEIDSVKFVFATFSSLSEKTCLNGANYEELLNNPLPFNSNPSVSFSNIDGGYGLFMLGATDTLTVKL